jgi:nitroreductase
MRATAFQTLLRRRRSIRKYTAKPVDKATQELLVEALLRAPTSRNGRSWHFVLVDDRTLLELLAQSKAQGSAFLKDASLGIVVTGDSSKTDVWVEDASIAAILVQLAAEEAGLGSCWIQIRNRPHDSETTAEHYVQKLLGLPDHLKVLAIVSLGYPDESKPGIPETELPFTQVSYNHFSDRP